MSDQATPAQGEDRSLGSANDTYWRVSERDGESGEQDIYFEVVSGGCPAEQEALKNEIERTLSALRIIYGRSINKSKSSIDPRFKEAFAKLLSLAQLGLVGTKPATSIASGALENLKNEVLDQEGGRVKNQYMLKLGVWALLFCAAALAGYFFVTLKPACFPEQIYRLRNFFILWSGCMVGAWCSFASRNVLLSFYNLSQLEKDMINPPLRLIFAGSLTSILGLVFVTGLADVVVGTFQGSNLIHRGTVAFLVGALCGMAEQALPAALMQRANSIIQANQKSV